jgi:hypothetical protein
MTFSETIRAEEGKEFHLLSAAALKGRYTRAPSIAPAVRAAAIHATR